MAFALQTRSLGAARVASKVRISADLTVYGLYTALKRNILLWCACLEVAGI